MNYDTQAGSESKQESLVVPTKGPVIECVICLALIALALWVEPLGRYLSYG